MEDKIVVRVPQRRYGAGQFTDDANGPLNRGNRMGSGGALLSSLVQFMVGAPVVDYSSFAFSGSLGAFPGKVITIDTSLPKYDQNVTVLPRPPHSSRPSFTDATAYSHYTNNLMQNRGNNASTATGTFTIHSSSTNLYQVSHPTLGIVDPSQGPFFVQGGLQKKVGSTFLTGTFAPDIDTDLYDLNGNFVLTIRISSVANYSTDTPTGVGWASNITATFNVINPNYTDELNWSDMANTNRGSGYSNPYTVLHFDTKRNQNLSPTDPMSMYDIQGLAFAGLNIDAMVYPVVNLTHSINLSRGGFNRPDLYSTSTNGIFTQFGAARAFGSVDPASQADRSADYFTIFRGPGYVRMLGQVSDPATESPDASEADKDVSYFFGKFNSYEEVSEYPHPMAFLGDIGYRSSDAAANRTRPWWRSSYGPLDTADSKIWSESFFNISAGYWILKAPSILSHDFVMGDSSLNTPAQAKALLPSQNIGRWYVNGAGTTTISIGTVTDSKKMVVTEFNGYTQAVAWDPVVGWQAPQGLFYQHLETPGAPRILPVTFRQIAPDDHSWATSGANSQTITADYSAAAVNETYENIGEIPGIYWMNNIERYDGATPVPYAAGSEFNAGGRTLRMVIGYSQSAGPNTTPVPASSGGNSGNLLFDMNEI